ncbi:adenylyl-sulfate kinase [Mucilaginibacter sabulilitoris]|uniref:Adenylyl-sulfate kinase n=1 Tax=Mucilaginibacter sabulilitoris TaxID=1173583 RepID=A0ABZ0TPG4_9SPHI|nr:adenylyl-sulfate kinase [Mucilaginibacter sabulilitoris]WPU93070.1 adenylyl-sulfate kinase [Mucilaginibacter sabulilitoris]
MILLFCGLSGAGKTTLAKSVAIGLSELGIKTEIIDGDEYRQEVCKDLGFSRNERSENIRRLGFIASRFSAHGIITIVSAINPYDNIRRELVERYGHVSIVHVDCPVDQLIERDTKGLYKRALLPQRHPNKLLNLTGINDQFDVPYDADLYINTGRNTIQQSTSLLLYYILNNLYPAEAITNKMTDNL